MPIRATSIVLSIGERYGLSEDSFVNNLNHIGT